VNGTPTAPCPVSGGITPASVSAPISSSGITEVAFTDAVHSSTGTSSGLQIVNYQLVRQQAVAGKRSQEVTYRADLLNSGPALGSVTGTLASLDPSSVQVVPGQGTLNFVCVPADNRVRSSNTFTILTTDRAVPFDFSKLRWTFQPGPAALNGGGRCFSPGDAPRN
jgi:hypothetical protein